jgi:hypothetical protein
LKDSSTSKKTLGVSESRAEKHISLREVPNGNQ